MRPIHTGQAEPAVSFPPPVRRAPTPSPTPAEQREQLVRHIASEPVLVQWLRDHVATQLLYAAQEAEEAVADLEPAVILLERRAAAHQRGDTPLW